jgi:hypothetical protein
MKMDRTTQEVAERILAKDTKVSPTIWTDVAQDLARGFLEIEELLKRAGSYTSHHSYCRAGVDYDVTCECGLEQFSQEVLEKLASE